MVNEQNAIREQLNGTLSYYLQQSVENNHMVLQFAWKYSLTLLKVT